MRTYGRQKDASGKYTWKTLTTKKLGNERVSSEDEIYLSNLAQCLLLKVSESPFYANFGIPVRDFVYKNIFPDEALRRLQAYFAPFFVALSIERITEKPVEGEIIYTVNAVLKNGNTVSMDVKNLIL